MRNSDPSLAGDRSHNGSGSARADSGNAVGQISQNALDTPVPHLEPVAVDADQAAHLLAIYIMSSSVDFQSVQPAHAGQITFLLEGSGTRTRTTGGHITYPAIAMHAPATHATTIDVRGPMRCIGIVLTPAAWGGLLPADADVGPDTIHDAATLLPDHTMRAVTRLLETRHGSDDYLGLARALAKEICSAVRPIPTPHQDILTRVSEWLNTSLNPSLADLYAGMPFTSRHVQRLVRHYHGMGPKVLARKYRALRAATLLKEPGLTRERGAWIAEHFSDQSHMIRELRHFTGKTVRTIGTNDGGTIAAEVLQSRHFRDIHTDVSDLPKG